MADYICWKRAKFNALCGTVNIPYGTEISESDGFLFLDGSPICTTASDTAHMKYILALHYPQKTQSTSLLVDTLLSLPSRESQAVFLATLIDTVTKSTKENIKESIDSL